MILADPYSAVAMKFEAELASRLPDGWEGDLAVVLGGDGFLLKTVAKYGRDLTYLGLNAGRVGFLLNDVRDWDRVAKQLANKAWTVHTFPVVEATATLTDRSTVTTHALNDIYMERSTGQTAHLRVRTDGELLVERLVADGIIFASALGSTAYAYSAGGAACHPTLEMLQVVPISPHHPKLSPFILPRRSRVEVTVLDVERRPVRAVADGREIEDVTALEVHLHGEGVRLAYLEGRRFTAQMIRKILKP